MRVAIVWIAAGLAAIGVNVTTVAAAPAEPQIVWKVQHRFRTFDPDAKVTFGPLADQGSDLDRRLDELSSLMSRATSNPAQLYTAGGDGLRADAYQAWTRLLQDETQNLYLHSDWSGAGTGRVARARKWARGYRRPELFSPDLGVAVRVTNAPAGAACTWTLDRAATVTAPCDRWIGAPLNGSTSLKVDVAGGPATKTWTFKPCRGKADCRPNGDEQVVPQRLLVSLGESYAAGEGSPDRQTRWGEKVGQTYFADLTPSSPKYDQDARYRWWHKEGVRDADFQPAEWWDPYCHRSLYSQHVVAAATYAAKHPHEAVTFISFSCAGAKVFSGIVLPQEKPPGVLEFKAPADSKKVRNQSQIRQMLDVLCAAPPKPTADDRKALEDLFAREGFGAEARRLGREDKLTCDAGQPLAYRPDAILLSIGGNDVGFGGAIMDGVIPRSARALPSLILLPIIRDAAKADPPDMVNDRILRELPSKYRFMKARIRDAVGVETVVIQSAYLAPVKHPSATRIPGADPLEYCGGYEANKAFVALRGILPDRLVNPRARWEFELTPEEEQNVVDGLLDPLNRLVGQMAQDVSVKGNRWLVAQAFVKATEPHGWCAMNPGETVELPYWSLDADGVNAKARGAWEPFSPAKWDAYAPRARYFRTPNDAILTQMANPEYKIGPLPLGAVLASGGAFHPTGEGYFLVGLNVEAELERALSDPPMP